MYELNLREHHSKVSEEGNWLVKDIYEIGDYTVTRYREEKATYTYESIGVIADFDEKNRKYLPDIYFNDGRFGDGKKFFEIQTHGYGAKSPEEIQKVIEGYQQAVEIVKVLTKEFIKEAK